MGNSASDTVPFTRARAKLSELAEQVKAGAAKIISKNGESYVALIDAKRLDYYHRLEREHIHLLLIDDARRGLADIAARRTQDADAAIAALQAQRANCEASIGCCGCSPGEVLRDWKSPNPQSTQQPNPDEHP